jgi:hypothetical protein
MKTLFVAAAAIAVLMLASTGEAFAQRGVMGGYGGRYDPQTVETVSGEVISIDRVAYGRGRYYGVHVVLKTAAGELSVHLGPSWFVDRQTMKIAPHDALEITGSQVTYDGKPALIAAEVKKGNESLRLRTVDGFPLWRGSGIRGMGNSGSMGP